MFRAVRVKPLKVYVCSIVITVTEGWWNRKEPVGRLEFPPPLGKALFQGQKIFIFPKGFSSFIKRSLKRNYTGGPAYDV